MIDEGPEHVTFEFYTPYVIACTPATDEPWGIYKPGGRNGLVLHGTATCAVQLSTDSGKTWQPCGPMTDGLDLTDRVKGLNQYQLRFDAPATALKGTGLAWRTVCQCNVATIPHLKDGPNRITFRPGGRALVAAGPTKGQAEAHLVDGAIGSKTATLELTVPRHSRPAHVYAASWQASGNPPADAAYRIDYSTDSGKSWQADRPRTGASSADNPSRPTSGARASAGGMWNCQRTRLARSACGSAMTGEDVPEGGGVSRV